MSDRSYDKLQADDLGELADTAVVALGAFTIRNPQHDGLRDRLLAICLCQGAALDHLDGVNGVKDFDVWMFFEAEYGVPACNARWRGQAEYTGPRFATSSRRIDLFGRSIRCAEAEVPLEAVRRYVDERRTTSAWHLAQKAGVVLWPEIKRGRVLWQPAARV